MVGSNFGIIYSGNAGSGQGIAGSSSNAVHGSGSLGALGERERFSGHGAHLSDFMLQMEDYTPLIPESITSHYLNMGGFQADDKRLVRLVSIAAQKYISDIIDDALQHSKARTHMQNSNAPGGSKAKERKFTLTMEDLQQALADYGINVRKMDYSQ